MRTLRRHRRWLLPWVAAALLWAQWLAMAHACTVPVARADAATVAAAVETPLPVAHMPGCGAHDMAAVASAADATSDAA